MNSGGDIETSVQAQLGCAEALTQLLAQERSALLGNDVAALEALTRDKNRHALELERLGQHVERMRAAAGVDSVRALLERAGIAAGAWQRLAELAAACLQANRDNAALLAARQQQIRSALQLLQPGGTPQIYGRGGAASLDFGARSFGLA